MSARVWTIRAEHVNRKYLPMKILTVRNLFLSAILATTASSSFATFVVDLNPGGEKLDLDNVKDSATSTGDVNGDLVDISVIGNADFANGNANIKPIKDGVLTSLTFTPENGDLFGSFSFRGQLTDAGDVTVTVQDNQGNPVQVFPFLGLPANADFSRIGIISSDNETIKWVQITGSFKEQKQTEFETLEDIQTPPEGSLPDGGATAMLLGGGISALAMLRRKLS
jgi:hypothetical protein